VGFPAHRAVGGLPILESEKIITNPRVSVVIAAYDEAENAEELTRRLDAVLRSLPGCAPELIFVVEGRDGTREILEKLGAEIPSLRILYAEDPSGLGSAFRRGFAAVSPGSDYVVTMDADLNHQPEEIPRLLSAARDRGADILVGSRFVEGGRADGTPVWKLFLSGTLNVIMRIVFGLRVRDKTSGFRIYRAEAIRRIEFRNDNFAFLPEILIRANTLGMAIAEEPIHFIYRTQGVSKMRFWTTVFSYLSLLKLGLRSRSS
jgi:dolichol-phosphate mannosyltransferase